MKAVLVTQAGDSSVLKVTDLPKPQVKAGWSLVKIKGFGINRSEIFTRKGYSPSVVFPRILGIECVGVVEVSTDDRLAVGQSVVSLMGEMGRAYDGSYAEYVLLPNEQIYPVETRLTWAELAAIPETYYTAFGAYKNLKVTDDEVMLVRAGASALGVAFVNLVKSAHPKAKVYASVRNLDKEEQLLAVGYDGVILDKDGILQTEQDFSKVLELIGPATIKDSFTHLVEGGILCSCGQLGGQWYLEDFDPIMVLQNNVHLTTFYSGNVNQTKLQEMFDFMSKYGVSVKPEKVFSLDEIAKAHDYLEGKSAFGKVIILNEGEGDV